MYVDFLGRAVLAGVGVALLSGPLGAIMVWRRMANFGDTLAHSTLLGLSLALVFNVSVYLGLLFVCIMVAVVFPRLTHQRQIGNEAVLSVLAYATLAIGLTLSALVEGVRVNLIGYFYGDILSVTTLDLVWIYSVAFVVLMILVRTWRSIVSLTVHREIAFVEGVRPERVESLVVILMACVFAVAMKLVGVLLITAFFIIPACVVRPWSKTPEQMAIGASGVGGIAVVAGMMMSAFWDWPAGPAMVIVLSASFVMSIMIAGVVHRWRR